jgi:hypothetical protein
MNFPTPLSHITTMVHQHLDALSRPLRNTIAHFTHALLQEKDIRQNHLAQGAPLSIKPDSFERRFQRFLANKRIPLEAAQEQLSRWVLTSLPDSTEEIVLIVDETSLAEHVRVMALCLAYQGRAIPLCWESYPANSNRSQLQVITNLLERVQRAMPPGRIVIVEADRGIGCSSDLLKVIVRLGWHYLVRVQKTLHLRLGEGEEETEVPFSALLAKEGDALPLCFGKAFKKAGWLSCGILGCFESGCKDAWCLLTNYPGATCVGYALRMWVEASFRDLKSNGWQWQRSRVRDSVRVGRLWLLMAVSVVFALSLGTQAACCGKLHREVARGTVRSRSVFVLGWRLFLAILRGRVPIERVLWQRLVLLPQLPQDAFKTVVQ